MKYLQEESTPSAATPDVAPAPSKQFKRRHVDTGAAKPSAPPATGRTANAQRNPIASLRSPQRLSKIRKGKWRNIPLQPGEIVLREYSPSFTLRALSWFLATNLTLFAVAIIYSFVPEIVTVFSSSQPDWQAFRQVLLSLIPDVFHDYVAWLSWSRIVTLFIAERLLTLGYAYWATKSNRWAVTNQRLLARLGGVNKRSQAIDYDRISDIEARQPALSPLFKHGKVLVSVAGDGRYYYVISGQADPDKMMDDIRRVMKKSLAKYYGVA